MACSSETGCWSHKFLSQNCFFYMEIQKEFRKLPYFTTNIVGIYKTSSRGAFQVEKELLDKFLRIKSFKNPLIYQPFFSVWKSIENVEPNYIQSTCDEMYI